ncbi:LysR family transcriptional regulator [Nitrospirillum viridazoti]|uniref:LysR family transcriptional regulator n=1 Tax=Nitrospirillum viridazoti CBAmc TaxID=1441467 RepID=A0A248JS41_9PROT|nr:LysR family transcriptional regulator [Nitrospirillum amazonense]ASG21301.1 LysR family transcriptional regulator [Nitrospirillum amazonense CBAmc]TWB32967.1 LysR family transcriptional regulator [Nitrospirillum amazonense]
MKDPRFAEFVAVFVDVVRAGSFSGAARRRGVTPSAIVRQIDALEHGLGVRVLVRSTRALAMTDAGERLFERGQRLIDDLVDVHAEIAAFDGAIAGVLRIACFPTFGKRYVLPVAGTLMRDHPGLSVELDLTERLADPARDRLDAVIRIGHLADSALIATKLADQSRLAVAAPGYLDRHGTPDGIDDLRGHRLLDKLHGADLLGWADMLGDAGGQPGCGAVVFRSDDFEALRLAALEGMGVAFLPSWVVGPDVRAGHLKRLALDGEPWARDPQGIFLLRALQEPSAKLRAFIDGLRSAIGTPPVWEP